MHAVLHPSGRRAALALFNREISAARSRRGEGTAGNLNGPPNTTHFVSHGTVGAAYLSVMARKHVHRVTVPSAAPVIATSPDCTRQPSRPPTPPIKGKHGGGKGHS